MSKFQTALSYMTPDEYLSFEQNSKIKHEYVDGQIFAISGATEAHNIICSNILVSLHSRLAGTRCRAFIADMKVHVKASNSFYYPDIMVTCKPLDPKALYKSSPVLIVEVLSPSTKQIDRREKLVAYRKLESLQEYILVHQNKSLIEHYRKDSEGKWSLCELGKHDELCIGSLPGGAYSLKVSEIYGEVAPPFVVREEEAEYEFES